MLNAERPDPLYIFGVNLDPNLLDLHQRALDVARVPQNDGVDDQTERSKLVLLALAAALPVLTSLAVEDARASRWRASPRLSWTRMRRR